MTGTVQFLSPSQAARRLGVSAKALRLYEARGLIAPLRTAAGWRAYGPEQLARGGEIATDDLLFEQPSSARDGVGEGFATPCGQIVERIARGAGNPNRGGATHVRIVLRVRKVVQGSAKSGLEILQLPG